MAELRTPRLIAYYLPQFHPIPENDEFWGSGFTEWTHLAAARPLYRGHDQPKIPGDLGFYDLRLPETRIAQANLARRYGIEGFCYWHYWFGGRRVLERPFQEVLESGQPDFPFCLAWANTSWTGVWYGAPERTLIEQTYPGPDDYRAHFESILPALRDPRYICVEERPLLLVFQPAELPDAKAFCAQWREVADRAGLAGLHLVGFGTRDWDPLQSGFDASVQHGPREPKVRGFMKSLRRRLRQRPGRPRVYAYREYVRDCFRKPVVSPLDYPVALPNWDNTPRAGVNGIVFEESTPELFRLHLREALELAAKRPAGHRIVFLKSWNEWAEGNYLEPDRRFGHAYLEVVRGELERAGGGG